MAALLSELQDFVPREKSPGPQIFHFPIRRTVPGRGYRILATVYCPGSVKTADVCWRNADGEFRRLKMQTQGAPRPGNAVGEALFRKAQQDDKLYLFNTAIAGGDVKGKLEYFLEVTDMAGQTAMFPTQGADAPVAVTVSLDSKAPTVELSPMTSAPASKPLKITAEVTDSSGVKWVRLRYRPVTQFEDYRTLEMKRAEGPDRYEAVVPAEHVVPTYDFMYFIEVMDNAGNGRIYPDLETEAPYVIVRLER